MMVPNVAGAGRIRRLQSVVVLCLLLTGGTSAAYAREGSIGAAEQVVNQVRGILGPVTRELVVEDDVFSEENIETGDEGATRIVFLDGTELTMGPKSRVTLDRYVYDPDTGAGEFVMNFIGGVFEFASGLIPGSAYDLRTPLANLAIRGTLFRFLVTNSRLQMIVPEGAVAAFGGGREALVDDPSDCLIWPGPAGGPALVPSEECQELLESVAVMTALLVAPAAGPPPRNWLLERRPFLPDLIREVAEERNCARLAEITDDDGRPVPLPSFCVSPQ